MGQDPIRCRRSGMRRLIRAGAVRDKKAGRGARLVWERMPRQSEVLDVLAGEAGSV